MKTKISVLLSVFLLAGFYAAISLAQAQEQKPQLYMFFDCAVKPGMVTKFEAALKEECALYEEGKSLYPSRAYSSDDFHYYSIVPIKNYADIDAWDKADEEMRKRVGEERFDTNEKAYGGTFEYNRIGFVYLRADLSYAPKEPRLKPEEVNFFYWGLCYVDSAKWDEFIEILKEYVALYKSKNVASGFTTYQGGYGTDIPFYFIAMSGKSPADFFAEDEKTTKILEGEKNEELWKRFVATLRKFEFKTGRYRPDLSYIPEAKKPVK